MLPELNEREARALIAKRVASELEDGALVNLGIGIPQLVPDYLPKGVRLILQTENGVINAGASADRHDLRVIDAGGTPVSVLPGGALISSELSFAIMRGGHIDVTVLGALEVDREGSLANWMIPQVRVPGMGGAMDIVTGAKKGLRRDAPLRQRGTQQARAEVFAATYWARRGRRHRHRILRGAEHLRPYGDDRDRRRHRPPGTARPDGDADRRQLSAPTSRFLKRLNIRATHPLK